jgi:hypothetical protein
VGGLAIQIAIMPMKIAVWYHCIISGGSVPIDTPFAIQLLSSQMSTLKDSGLLDEADEFHIGVNGGCEDAKTVRALSPCPKAVIYEHGSTATTELPTLKRLQLWLPTHRDWFVLYHHIKGVTHPHDEQHQHHRQVMEKAVVTNWRTCVKDLARGFDAVGVNLVDPDTRPTFGKCRFFAGNFWWATSAHLLRLPKLPAKAKDYSTPQRCIAELWIGSCRHRPIMMDYERPELYRFWERHGAVKRL